MTDVQRQERLQDRRDYLSMLKTKHAHYEAVIKSVEAQITKLETAEQSS